jgi:hypothetical protein
VRLGFGVGGAWQLVEIVRREKYVCSGDAGGLERNGIFVSGVGRTDEPGPFDTSGWTV